MNILKLNFSSFLISGKNATCLAFTFNASSGYVKMEKKWCLYIRNILENFVEIRNSFDKDRLQTDLSGGIRSGRQLEKSKKQASFLYNLPI